MFARASFVFVLAATVALGCDQNDEGPNAGEKPESEPSPVKKEKPGPKAEAGQIECGAAICTPPEECFTVLGSLQGAPATKECWIPCDDSQPCPDGYACTMTHDGPGQVCRKSD